MARDRCHVKCSWHVLCIECFCVNAKSEAASWRKFSLPVGRRCDISPPVSLASQTFSMRDPCSRRANRFFSSFTFECERAFFRPQSCDTFCGVICFHLSRDFVGHDVRNKVGRDTIWMRHHLFTWLAVLILCLKQNKKRSLVWQYGPCVRTTKKCLLFFFRSSCKIYIS